jgi:hypothetical protein
MFKQPTPQQLYEYLCTISWVSSDTKDLIQCADESTIIHMHLRKFKSSLRAGGNSSTWSLNEDVLTMTDHTSNTTMSMCNNRGYLGDVSFTITFEKNKHVRLETIVQNNRCH